MRINGVHGDYFSDGIMKVIFKVIYRLKLGKRYYNMNYSLLFMKTTILTQPIYHSSRNLGNQKRTSWWTTKEKVFEKIN